MLRHTYLDPGLVERGRDSSQSLASAEVFTASEDRTLVDADPVVLADLILALATLDHHARLDS